ncbi:hypothetical protein Tco_1412562 [Tanacetum coccineum]
MGCSLSQRHTDPPMSSIHEFLIKDMYTPEFSDSFQENTSSFQEPAREESPVEVATSPPKTKKLTRGHQKRTIQSDDAPYQTAWTHEEEIAFTLRANKTVWSSNVQYGEREIEDGAPDRDGPKWMQSELPKFSAKSRGGSKRYKSSGSSSFNKKSREASIYLNANVGYDDEDHRALGSSSTNDEALARLMVTEMASQEKEERDARLAMEELRVEIKAKYNLAY